MDWLRAIWFKLSGLGRRRAESDFDEEVSSHMARLVERFVAAGMSPDEAGRAARRQFGNVALLKDVRADFARLAVEAWWWDLRFAIRGLRRNVSFAAAAVLLLALGIGANTAVFGVLDALFLRPLPVERPADLALVQLVVSPKATFQGAAKLGFVTVREFLGPDAGIPSSSFEQLRRSSQGFSGLTAEGGRTIAELRPANDTGEPTQVRTAFVSGNYFTVLGVPPAAGRVLIDADDDRAEIPAVVISYRFWDTHFHRDVDVVGRSLYLNDTLGSVVGVARAGFDGSVVGNPTDVWVPVASRQSVWPTAASDLTVIGRLKPGVSRADAQAGLRALVPSLRLADAFGIPTAPPDSFDLRVADGSTGISSLRERHAGALGIGMGAAVVVLLIACANIAVLVLARATARRRELALQISLGAGRWRIVRQIFLQNAVLAVLGGAAGCLLAQWGAAMLSALVSTSPDALPGVGGDWRLLGFSAAATFVAALGCGLVPAIHATRLDPKRALSEDTPSTPRGRLPLERLLIPAQIAASMALLVCALLFVRTLGRLDAVDLGFDPDRLLIVQFNTGTASRGAALATRADDVERQLQSLPGVASTALVTATPFGDTGGGSRIQVPDYTPAPTDPYFTATTVVGSGFFRTSGIHLLRGRDFTANDAAPGADGSAAPARVAIVNEAFVRRFAGPKDPLSLRFTMSRATYEIVGVARDARYDDVRQSVSPLIYFPVAQDPSRLRRLAILVRFNGPATALAALTSAIRTETQKVGGLRVARVATLRELVDRSFDEERLAATVSSAAGSLAMLLMSVGLLGTVAHTVTRRTRELGIRAALGGGRWSILGMLIRETLALVLMGIAVGIPLAIATARLLSSKLFGVGVVDPFSLGAAGLMMVVVAIAASFAPAYRAAGVHPMAALRHD